MLLGSSSASASPELAGKWQTDHYSFEVPAVRDGIEVTIPYDLPNMRALFVGTFSGRTFTGHWLWPTKEQPPFCPTTKNGSPFWGPVRLEFDEAGETVTGKWLHCPGYPMVGGPVPESMTVIHGTRLTRESAAPVADALVEEPLDSRIKELKQAADKTRADKQDEQAKQFDEQIARLQQLNEALRRLDVEMQRASGPAPGEAATAETVDWSQHNEERLGWLETAIGLRREVSEDVRERLDVAIINWQLELVQAGLVKVLLEILRERRPQEHSGAAAGPASFVAEANLKSGGVVLERPAFEPEALIPPEDDYSTPLTVSVDVTLSLPLPLPRMVDLGNFVSEFDLHHLYGPFASPGLSDNEVWMRPAMVDNNILFMAPPSLELTIDSGDNGQHLARQAASAFPVADFSVKFEGGLPDHLKAPARQICVPKLLGAVPVGAEQGDQADWIIRSIEHIWRCFEVTSKS
jgi:hypothetical protein